MKPKNSRNDASTISFKLRGAELIIPQNFYVLFELKIWEALNLRSTWSRGSRKQRAKFYLSHGNQVIENMFPPRAAYLRANFLLPKARHLKCLTSFWRWQKTEASPLVKREIFDDPKPAKSAEVEARPFRDIPSPDFGLTSLIKYFKETEGFTKVYKLTNRLFTEHGPIFRGDILFGGKPAVYTISPDDFENVFRSEGRYPRRPPILDIWIELRKRRNYFIGVFSA